MDFKNVKEEKRPIVSWDNYRDNSIYPWMADWEMPDKEFDDMIAKLKKKEPETSIEQLKKENKQKFSSYAMKKTAFHSKYWVKIYHNPEYKYDFENEA